MWRSDRRKATLGKGKNRYTNERLHSVWGENEGLSFVGC